MFVDHHRYPGIWEISFWSGDDKVYRDQLINPEQNGKLFILAPKEPFRLPELVDAQNII